MNLRELLKRKILIIDGAMGTQLQKRNLSAADYGGEELEGCNENLVLTCPQAVVQVHEDYLSAGADIIETNTFGANDIVLAEYGLQDKVEEINIAAVRLARAAATPFAALKQRYVAASIGPTTKSVFVTESISFEQLKKSYARQIRALIGESVDLLLIETAQDLMNVKAALDAAFEVRAELKATTPVIVSASVGLSGTMLSGHTVEAYYTALAHYDLAAMGFNCASGPAEMTDKLRTLSALSRFPVLCMPNAGLPDENGLYNQTPEDFAARIASFANSGWVNIAGGCCGTTPDHIAHLALAMMDKTPRKPVTGRRKSCCGTDALFIDEVQPPVLVGERANSIGSKIFREMIAASRWNEALEVAKRQVKNGAQVIDVCLANPERDELADANTFFRLVARGIKAPVMIDTSNADVAFAAAALCSGKSIWNSVNLETGEQKLMRAAELNRRYGTALVIGCIDEDREAMAVTMARKLDIAKRAHDFLAYLGVPEEDMIFDALVFPAATAQGKYAGSAAATVAAVAEIKKQFPACSTILGVSNVSYGLPTAAREALNAIFLQHCVKAGLEMAIVNTEKLRRYSSLTAEEISLGEKLLFSPEAESAAAFANLFRAEKKPVVHAEALPPEKLLAQKVFEGSRTGVAELVGKLLETNAPLDIIKGPLSEGMARVGELFAKGELIVTEVLQSAEVMQEAVNTLRPKLAQGASLRGKMVLATVKGDVHDIGKNLVKMIFESNGFEVVDLGVKVPNMTIVEEALRVKPDFIGLSGLLTRSAENMVSVLEDLKSSGIAVPVVVGGAALSEKFVQLKLVPVYGGQVIYAADALDGLNKILAAVPSK